MAIQLFQRNQNLYMVYRNMWGLGLGKDVKEIMYAYIYVYKCIHMYIYIHIDVYILNEFYNSPNLS